MVFDLFKQPAKLLIHFAHLVAKYTVENYLNRHTHLIIKEDRKVFVLQLFGKIKRNQANDFNRQQYPHDPLNQVRVTYLFYNYFCVLLL